jgi:hypothetical protein
MQQLFGYFEQRLAETIAAERAEMCEIIEQERADRQEAAAMVLAHWVQPKLDALYDEIVKYVDAQYKRSDTQMLSNQIRRITSELRDEIRKINPTSKQPEPIDIPRFLPSKTPNLN